MFPSEIPGLFMQRPARINSAMGDNIQTEWLAKGYNLIRVAKVFDHSPNPSVGFKSFPHSTGYQKHKKYMRKVRKNMGYL